MKSGGAPVTGAPLLCWYGSPKGTSMRYTIAHITVTDNLPQCPACGTVTVFAKAADIGKDGRVYMIFRCPKCSVENKVWRPEWQALHDMLVADE
jgi:ribosomal protein S27AE